ncbi:MAG: YggT family protein [SAR324 cluster bacterium]|nr:YggT family protein [SAR324 cluster bacterium]
MTSLFVSLIRVLDAALGLYSFCLLGYAVMSWIQFDPLHPVNRFLSRACEPVLTPIRRTIPPIGNLDISVVVALVGIHIIRTLLF